MAGETCDTVPEILQLVAEHPDVDAVVLLGVGIQSNTASMMRNGPFFPDHGLERIVASTSVRTRCRGRCGDQHRHRNTDRGRHRTRQRRTRQRLRRHCTPSDGSATPAGRAVHPLHHLAATRRGGEPEGSDVVPWHSPPPPYVAVILTNHKVVGDDTAYDITAARMLDLARPGSMVSSASSPPGGERHRHHGLVLA